MSKEKEQVFKTENYIKDVLFIFFAQIYLIIGTTLIIFAAAVLIASFWPRTYGASGSVLLRGKDLQKSPQALERIDPRTFPITREDLFSEMELLRSPDVVKAAIKDLQEAGEPAGEMDPGILTDKLQAQILPASHIIELGMEGKEPAIMVKQINAIIQQYLIHRTEIHYPSAAVKFYADQAENFRTQMDDIEKELIALVETSETPDPMAEISKNLLLKRNIQQELFMVRNSYINVDEDVEHLNELLGSGENYHFNFLANPTLNQISQQLTDLKYERDKTLRKYVPEDKHVTLIEEQIVKTQRMLNLEVGYYRDQLATKRTAGLRKIEDLDAMVAQIDSDNVALKRQALRQTELDDEMRLLRDSYQTFVRRREEARMNSSIDAGYSSFFVSIINRGHASSTPLFPQPKILIPLGLIAGLLTGFALGFLREYFDHTFKNPRDVETFAGMPLLFSIPVLTEPEPIKEPLQSAAPPGDDDPELVKG